MSYIEESLSSGEVIHKVFQLHWFAKVPMYCWLVLGLVTFGLTWLLAGTSLGHIVGAGAILGCTAGGFL